MKISPWAASARPCERQTNRGRPPGRRRNRALASLVRALLSSSSQDIRRINSGFAAGLSLFGHMDQPSQRLHLGQSAGQCPNTGKRPARGGPRWFKWKRSPAHFSAFLKETRPPHSPALQAAALVQRRHTRQISQSGDVVALRFPQHPIGPALAPEMVHLWRNVTLRNDRPSSIAVLLAVRSHLPSGH
jgi:hypothetical protein